MTDKKQVPGIEARQGMKARTGSEGDRLSQKWGKKIEEGFGRRKSIGGVHRGRVVGRWKLRQLLEIGAACLEEQPRAFDGPEPFVPRPNRRGTNGSGPSLGAPPSNFLSSLRRHE